MKRIVWAVTVTGADDSIRPEELVPLAKEFPFMEFGILLSAKQQGGRRFPSREWLEELYTLWRQHGLILSGHLCGRWVRELCLGGATFFTESSHIQEMFGRFQLNFHAEPHKVDIEKFIQVAKQHIGERPVIFQMEGENDDFFYSVASRSGVNAYPLFDSSGGIGRLPQTWPRQTGVYSGYAGGLGPENIQQEMPKIAAVAPGPIWVDFETLARSRDDEQFEVAYAADFARKIKPWISDAYDRE